MESLPRIRVHRRFFPDLSFREHEQVMLKLIAELRQELVETEGVEDFSTGRIDTWIEPLTQEQVIEMSVDASARPEDW